MKKLIFSILSLALLASAATYAQITQEQLKERKELAKATKKQLNEKASKAARKEAKTLTKEGWRVTPGALPLEKQLDRSYMMQYEFDGEGFPRYIMADAMSIGGNYDAAKESALELAKQNLAGQIQTEVTAIIENDVKNEQLSQGEAVSLTRSISAGRNLISQSIGRAIPVTEAHRMVNGKNYEVLVRIAYSMDAAKAAAKKAIKEDLEKRGDQLRNKLDQLLGW